MSKHGRHIRHIMDGKTPHGGHTNKYAAKEGGGKTGVKQEMKKRGSFPEQTLTKIPYEGILDCIFMKSANFQLEELHRRKGLYKIISINEATKIEEVNITYFDEETEEYFGEIMMGGNYNNSFKYKGKVSLEKISQSQTDTQTKKELVEIETLINNYQNKRLVR